MTGVGTEPIAAFIAAVLVAALFVACGGSSSDSSSTRSGTNASPGPETTARSRSQESSSKGASEQSDGRPQDAGQGQDSGQTHQGNGSQGKSAEAVETPLKVSGGGAGQFRVKGGDNSIQEFGAEGDESELQEAAEVVHAFYVSRLASEWAKACSYLAKENIEQLEKLASQSPQATSTDCASVLHAFTRPVSAPVAREITTVDAGSLRREGERGFLIYYGADHVTYAMPLKDEDGTWKVAALSGTTLD